jgi:uncharacterized protein HemY
MTSIKGKTVKICSLCLLPRPDHEPVCTICENDEFSAAELEGDVGLEYRLLAENRLDMAYRSLEADVARGEEDGRRALWLAWLAHTFGDTRAVEIWCHEGIRLDPDSPEPHLMLGLVMMRGERWAEAVEEFEAALNKPGVALERRALLETYRADALANIPEW